MPAREDGIQALKTGDLKRALQLLTQAVKEHPQDAQSFAYLGTAYGQAGHFPQAVECFRSAARLTPQSAAIYFNLGAALEKAGRPEEALKALQQVVALDPSHERARQALARMGAGAAPAAPTPPAPAPPIPAPEPLGGLADFAIGGGAPAAPTPPPTAPPAPAPGSPLAAAPTAPPVSAYGAPINIYAAAAPPPPPAPTLAGPPPTAGPPPGGMMPLGDWTPPPQAGPPQGMAPMGDWTPPPGAPAPGSAGPAPWEPPRPSQPVAMGAPVGGPIVSSVGNQEDGISKSAWVGNCYISGMMMGVWWGLIGALVTFFSAMMFVKDSAAGTALPRAFALCMIVIAGGMLLWGIIGAIGSNAEEPDKVCGGCGAGLGLLTNLILMPMLLASVGALSFGSLLGTIWVSWKMGTSLGSSIGEQHASVFIVAAPGAVAVTRSR
jgi:hypothetical protein